MHTIALILTSDEKFLLFGQQFVMLLMSTTDWKTLGLLTFIPNSYTFITKLILWICDTLKKIQMVFLDPASKRQEMSNKWNTV